MNDNTVLDLMNELMRNFGNRVDEWKDECIRQLVGQTVITW